MNVKKDSIACWLGAALAATLLINVGVVAGQVMGGYGRMDSLQASVAHKVFLLKESVGDDSWRPMLKAYNRKIEDPHSDIYSVLFQDRVKFQYPPSSLIFFKVLPSSLTRPVNGGIAKPLIEWLSWLSRIAILLTVVCSAIVLGRSAGTGWTAGYRPLLCLALGLTYYPLIFTHKLGQIQVYIDLLAAFALFSQLAGKDARSGLCMGVCALIKPQYGVFVLWGLLRKKWSFAVGFSAAFVAGLAVSLALFGLQDHLDYLQVLKMLSRHGEAYWPNQSVNGLLNRLFDNGDPVIFSMTDFAPYHPIVYAGTLISSIALLAAALWPLRAAETQQSSALNFAIMLAAATMASPIAWEHHYGTFLPIFALALPILMRFRPWGKATAALLLVSYVCMAQVIRRPEIIATVGPASSHLFFGALVLFGLLLSLRMQNRTA